MKKLTLSQAQEIKHLLWEGLSQRQLSLKYNISQPTISRIVLGLGWSWVKWPDGSDGPMSKAHQDKLKKDTHNEPDLNIPEEIRQLLPEAINQLYEAEDDKLKTEITTPGPAPESSGKPSKGGKRPQVSDGLPWENILTEAGHLAIVKEAASSSDSYKKQALSAVFGALPRGQWDTDVARRLVERVELTLKG